ncbi:SPOR domain-containing protein|uniref:SPOR domain-containing protein n=1 Tax=Noviherbaspirillum sp. L7-7A TaxID=2850560 RepID=UPI001C2B78D8|nr:SPOR domain-containing protein [Noviherbaspirillum sp. L7-7A]MBV0880448.1 SPOR domain-containing protein [Noviherbaspirillum sp. L7-7A]
MLKFVLGALLVANLAMFVIERGEPAGHEPARMKNQLYPDRIRLLPATASAPAAAADAPAAPVAAVATAAAPSAATAAAAAACVELASFTAAEAGRFEARMAELGLADRVSRRDVPTPSSYMVMIPPQGSREAADAKTEELRRLGITDTFIIQDNSARRWGIALGTFRSEEAAQSHLAAMSRRGVRTARVEQFGTGPARIAIQLRGLDAAAEAQITRARAEFPRQEAQGCG